jgi:hypothetical protein
VPAHACNTTRPVIIVILSHHISHCFARNQYSVVYDICTTNHLSCVLRCQVSQLLGCPTWTGGGPGLMQAASHGAAAAGGDVAGIRLQQEAGTTVLSGTYLPEDAQVGLGSRKSHTFNTHQKQASLPGPLLLLASVREESRNKPN